MLELIKVVGGIAGSLVTIVGCVTLFIKPLRSKVIEWVKKTSNSEQFDRIEKMLQEHIENDKPKQESIILQGEALMGILRDNITKMYYRNLPTKTIPSYEKENLVRMYTIYSKLNGNSYVSVVYKEMLEFDVIK